MLHDEQDVRVFMDGAVFLRRGAVPEVLSHGLSPGLKSVGYEVCERWGKVLEEGELDGGELRDAPRGADAEKLFRGFA